MVYWSVHIVSKQTFSVNFIRNVIQHSFNILFSEIDSLGSNKKKEKENIYCELI